MNTSSSSSTLTPIKLDLDINKGSLIVNRRQRDENSTTTRAILQRKTTVGITDEQIIRIRKTMSRLFELAPVNLTPEMKLAKAFMIWAEKLPLMQKCDELASQLRERSYALTTIKDCYLRDIVSIRVHLENYYKERNMDASLKELNSIPSVDLRPLIQTTDDQHSQKSSNSLKDSLMKANLVSPEISENWLKNPWDQSHAYAIYRERKDQIKLSMPSGGNSINLYAPSRHRLYVKYCKQCIGIMTFVTDWNSDIEKMIQKRIESKTNEELRQVIRNLNDYLIDKSEECEKLKIELDTIRSGGKYLSVWQQTEKNMYEKTDLEAKTKRFRELYHEYYEIALMADEDRRCVAERCRQFQEDLARGEKEYKKELVQLRDHYEAKIESKDEAIKSMKEALYERDLLIEQKDLNLEKQIMKLNEQTKETERYIRVNQQLLISIDEKDRILSDYRQEAMTMIESLELQVAKLNEDVNSLERQNENLQRIQEEKEEEERVRLQLEQEKRLARPSMRPGGQLYDELSEDQPSQSNHLAHFLKMKAVIGVLPRHLRKVLAHNITKYAPVPVINESDDLDVEGSSLLDEEDREVQVESPPLKGQIQRIQEEDEENEKCDIRNDETDEIQSLESFESKHCDGEGEIQVAQTSSPQPVEASNRKTVVEKKPSTSGRLTSVVSSIKPSPSSPKSSKRQTEIKKTSSRTTMVTDVVRASQKFRQGSVSKRNTLVSRSSSSFRSPSLLSSQSSGVSIPEKNLTDKAVLADVLAGDEDEPKETTGFSSLVRTKLVTRQTLRTRLSIAKKLSSFEMPISPANHIISTVGQIQEEVFSPSSSTSSPTNSHHKQYQVYNQELLRAQSSGGSIGGGSVDDFNEEGLGTNSINQQQSLHNLSSSYHEGVSNLLELLVPYIKPPTSLKIVAIAVRFCVRFYNGIMRKDYDLLGSWGQKQLLSSYKNQYEESQKEIEECKKEQERFEKKNQKLLETSKTHLSKINILEKEKRKQAEQFEDLKEELKRMNVIVRRYKIIAQNERAVAFEFMKYIGYIRQRLYVMGSSKDIPLTKVELPTVDEIHTPAISSVAPSTTKSQRLLNLHDKLVRSVKSFLEVLREQKTQFPLKVFQLNPNFSINFNSYGSKIRNESRDMKHYFRYTLFEINQIEKKYLSKQEKLNELTLRINEMIATLQCPTCIEYKGLYLLQLQKKAGDVSSTVGTNILDFNWDDEKFASNPTIQRLKQRLRKEIIAEISEKYENDYRGLLEKYIAKEEDYRQQIQSLESEKNILKKVEVKSSEIIQDLRDKMQEKEDRVYQLMKHNAVLRIAIQDSYRVYQNGQEEMELKENQLRELLQEYQEKHENRKDFSAQLNSDQESLLALTHDSIHQIDESLQLRAKTFLKRYTGISQVSTSSTSQFIPSAHHANRSSSPPRSTIIRTSTLPASQPSTTSGHHSTISLHTPSLQTDSTNQGNLSKRLSKFETIRNIPSNSQTNILPPSKLIHMEISEEDTEGLEREENDAIDVRDDGKESEESSRVDDVIYKPAYQLDLKKTSQMAAHLQQSLLSRPSSSTGYLSEKETKMIPNNRNLITSSSSMRASRSSPSFIQRPLSGNDAQRGRSHSTLLGKQTIPKRL